jgi:hypothetical protein
MLTHTFTQRLAHIIALTLVVLLTRVGFLGIGEPDSSLFVRGIGQWMRGGAQALATYSQEGCAFYYAALACIIQLFHIPENHYIALMSILSMLASIGLVLAGYLLGVRFVGAAGAFKATLLFSLSPGLWWATMEPHPQAVSICFALLALLFFVRFTEGSGPGFVALSAVSFAVAMAIKNDAVLISPAFIAIVIWIRPQLRTAAVALMIVAIAGCTALLLARMSYGSASQAVTAGVTELALYFAIPGPAALVKQMAPIVFGLGLVTALVIAVVVPVVLVKDAERLRWIWMIAVWSLPGYLFWIFITGNNARHNIVFGLPLLWLCASRLRARHIVALLAISALIPANSNMTVFPSPDVPNSVRLAAAKRQYIEDMAADLSRTDSCFVGSYTNDYLTHILMNAGGRVTAAVESNRYVKVRMPDKVDIELFRKDPWTDKIISLGSCRSLEYNAAGEKVRFLGSEWQIPEI